MNINTIKAKAIIGSMTLVTAAAGVLVVPHVARGDFNFDGLNDRVQKQQQEIDNHENRISTNEKEITTLKDDPTPTTNDVRPPTVRQSSTTGAAAAPAPGGAAVSPVVISPTPEPEAGGGVGNQPTGPIYTPQVPVPSRSDVEGWLATVGAPGTLQAEKRAYVQQQFDHLGYHNEGVRVLTDLSSYSNY